VAILLKSPRLIQETNQSWLPLHFLNDRGEADLPMLGMFAI
jgi:hypothetical protein